MGIDPEQARAEYLDSLGDPSPPIGELMANTTNTASVTAKQFRRSGVVDEETGVVPDSLRRQTQSAARESSEYYTVTSGEYFSDFGAIDDYSVLPDGMGKGKREQYEFSSKRGGTHLAPDDMDPKIAAELGVPSTQAAPLSVIPTSSINPDKPRTVAAGYDPTRMVLTVVFRDGTFYNYYEIDATEWRDFRARVSKGRYIKASLDRKIRGTASAFGMPAAHREALYRAARTAQHRQGGKQEDHVKDNARRRRIYAAKKAAKSRVAGGRPF